MKKPEALNQLLTELAEERLHSDVETIKTSKAIIYPDEAAMAADDGITLNAAECTLLFASEDTVDRLLDSGITGGAALALFDITISTEMKDVLERRFQTVDEG